MKKQDVEVVVVLKIDETFSELDKNTLAWAIWQTLMNSQVLIESADFFSGNKKIGEFQNEFTKVSVRKPSRRRSDS